ncbi:MAG: hypothetical protein GF355_06195, partial [Candidatus Eisenbacteria bacterium]|nr:hypothetical protein [Candidatus Eisenbacteria bacterium]
MIWPPPDLEASLVEAMEEAVATPPGDALHLTLEACRERVVRMAAGDINQSLSRRVIRLIVVACDKQRRGVVSTGILLPEEIAQAVGRARRTCQVLPTDPQYPGMPGPPRPAAGMPDRFDEATAAAAPEQLATVAAACLESARQQELEAAGALRVTERLLLARNSEGLATRSPSTKADLSVTCFAGASGERSSGYANRFAWKLGDLDPRRIARDAGERARAGLQRRTLAPGPYTALLEPTAVADLVGIMARIGFDATQVGEHRSFASGRLGEPILDRRFCLRDDPRHPKTAAPLIDYEGVPTRSLTLVENGVLRETATHHRSAHIDGQPSNGHAADPLSAVNDVQFQHLVVDPGGSRREELMRSLGTGIVISRLWYARVTQTR